MRIVTYLLPFIIACAAHEALSMEIKVEESSVMMSGDVVGFECEALRTILASSKVETVVLANSRGGNAEAGYCVGTLIRERGISTSITGSCNSSCSRMWLGGVSRVLTNGNSRVGLHGNYGRGGALLPEAPSRLRSWIPRYAPAVDRSLMEQWIKLPTNSHMMYFYRDHAEVCDGRECVPIPARNARNAGLSTN